MATTTVTGQWLTPSGDGCQGRVTFRLVSEAYHDGLAAIFPPVLETALLDPSGSISVEIEPTSGDDEAFDAAMTYQVTEIINGYRAVYYVDIPTAPSVDLGTLLTYDDPPAISRQLVDIDLTDLGFATLEQVRQYGVSVSDYGAAGDGVTDDTAAIQAAIDAVTGVDNGLGGLGGGTVYLPPGVYVVSDTLTIGEVGDYVSGFNISGSSTYGSVLETTADYGSSSVIKFINARRSGCRDFAIHGNADTPIRAAVEFHRDTPGGGAPAITGCHVDRVAMGRIFEGDALEMMVDGIRVTANGVGQDGNNDFHCFRDFNISGFSGTGISLETKQSVSNVIDGGIISFGAVAVSTAGGSFDIQCTAIQEITDCEFDFVAPYSEQYTTLSTISNIQAETDLGNSATFIRTTDDDFIDIAVSQYSRYGSELPLTVVDYNAPGMLSISDSRFQLGQDSQLLQATHEDSSVTMSGVSHGFTDVEWEGELTISGGHEYTSTTYTPGTNSSFARLGGTDGSWSTYTPTLAGTGWAIGDGTISGRFIQFEKTVHYTLTVVFGATSTFGASAAPTITLPVPCRDGRIYQIDGFCTDTGAFFYNLAGRLNSGGLTVSPYVTGTAGVLSNVTATSPFTWVATDILEMAGTYEAA